MNIDVKITAAHSILTSGYLQEGTEGVVNVSIKTEKNKI